MSALNEWRPSGGSYVFPLAHWQAPIILALIVAEVADRLVDSSFSNAVVIALLMVTLASTLATIRHDRVLCLTCAENFPLDAAMQAEGKRRLRLRCFHLVADHNHLMIAVVISAVVVSHWVWWAFLPVWTVWLVMAWGGYWHRILEPWCPFCRRGGGGGPHECEPDPIPTPTVEGIR